MAQAPDTYSQILQRAPEPTVVQSLPSVVLLQPSCASSAEALLRFDMDWDPSHNKSHILSRARENTDRLSDRDPHGTCHAGLLEWKEW